MPDETQTASSGKPSECEIVLGWTYDQDGLVDAVIATCLPCEHSMTVFTPEEAWAWEQEHRREVAGGGVNVQGTLVEPNFP